MDRIYLERKWYSPAKALQKIVSLVLNAVSEGIISAYFAIFVLYSMIIGPILRIIRKPFGLRTSESELEHAINEWIEENRDLSSSEDCQK